MGEFFFENTFGNWGWGEFYNEIFLGGLLQVLSLLLLCLLKQCT